MVKSALSLGHALFVLQPSIACSVALAYPGFALHMLKLSVACSVALGVSGCACLPLMLSCGLNATYFLAISPVSGLQLLVGAWFDP